MSFLANMSPRRKITYGIVLVYLAGLVGLSVVYGVHAHKNNTFNIVSAYHLTTWVHLVGPLDINKGVLYLLMTAVLTIGILRLGRPAHGDAAEPGPDRGRMGLRPVRSG